MSKRLLEAMEKLFITHGKNEGLAILTLKTGRSVQMIERYRKTTIPEPNLAYKLALACGLSEKEALSIAKECFLDRAKDTA